MLELNLTLVVQMALFLVFAGLMNAVFFGPVTRTLAERKAYIASKQAQASADLQQAQALQHDYEVRLKAMRLETQDAIQTAVAEAEAKRQALLASVKTEVDRQVAEARETIRSERDRAIDGLAADAGQLASLIAHKVMGESAVPAGSEA